MSERTYAYEGGNDYRGPEHHEWRVWAWEGDSHVWARLVLGTRASGGAIESQVLLEAQEARRFGRCLIDAAKAVDPLCTDLEQLEGMLIVTRKLLKSAQERRDRGQTVTRLENAIAALSLAYGQLKVDLAEQQPLDEAAAEEAPCASL